jgi:polyphosphate kinase
MTGSTPARRRGKKVADAPPVAVALPGPDSLPEDRYFNRELSWLDFNDRVLTLAADPASPALERAKFLAIFASNLDEFYMVRVAGLKRRQQTGLPLRRLEWPDPNEQLVLIAQRAKIAVARHAACFAEQVCPALAAHNIEFARWDDLNEAARAKLHTYFRDHVFPVLTPLAVDPVHPFPYISGLSLNLAVVMSHPSGENAEYFARIKVPNNVPRFVAVDDRPGCYRFLPVEQLISAHLDQLFPGMHIVDQHVFRVTRNAELEVDDDRDEDLLEAMERELARRRFGPPVRLEVTDDVSPRVLDLLIRELEVGDNDVVRVPGMLDLSALWQVYDSVLKPGLKDRTFVPATHPRLSDTEVVGELGRPSIFATIRDGDVLVHHPYHSFSTSVQRFIEQAAADPQVLAIKQTLYRTSGDSPVVDALVDAAEAGKQVVVIVEVKARFDEMANIGWAKTLEKAGCHVVYGVIGLKTHSKTALVVRQEGNVLRRYSHIGTGNYHPKTARTYEDFGLLTADPEIGADLTDLFNVLTGYSRQTAYRRLLVAPYGLRHGLLSRINREAARARSGLPAVIQLKVNALVDEAVIDALYMASIAGVKIDLLVRGICAIKPGIPGLSESIRVRSILGRFLEHSRVFRFGADSLDSGDLDAPEYWIGSADLMHRNLDRRVEALVRVTDRTAKASLQQVLDVCLSDQSSGFDLQPDGVWQRRLPSAERPLYDPQELLLRLANPEMA